MKSTALLLTLTFLLAPSVAQAGDMEETIEPIVIGHLHRLTSVTLKEEREVLVWLPRGYEKVEDRYPLLVLLDGEAHFHHATGLVEYNALGGRIPPMIVVGVRNTCRGCNLDPRQGADTFLTFLEKELIPWVERRYRTQPFRILVGHSLGGQFALHAMLHRPDLFQGYLAISPSLAWDEERMEIFRQDWLPAVGPNLAGLTDRPRLLRITRADEEGLALESLDAFLDTLERSAPDELDWKVLSFPQEDHSSTVPRSIEDGLRDLYHDWSPRELIRAGDLRQADEHYRALSRRYGYEISTPEYVLNLIGYARLGRGETDEAVRVFRENLRRFPDSANCHDSLGEALERSGDLKGALKSYRRAVKLGKRQESPFLETYEKNLKRVRKELGK